MSIEHIIPTTVNPDLQKERNGASFQVEEFTNWWYGGPENLKFKRELELHILDGLDESYDLFHYKSHEEITELALKQAIDLAKKLQQLQKERNPGGSDIWPKMFPSSLMWPAMPAGNPFDVHYNMMVISLKNQGSDEQYEKFGKRAERLALSGAYAQTELGHGTFVRGLETRADYDHQTNEFVLNTPTITAYKWWPGGLAQTANHCIVVAQMFIDGQAKGVEMFFVQLRDEETHMPLPGIDIGDIGTKMGFLGVNNGYLGFKNVRIPRSSLLMRNTKVLPDGTHVKSPVSQLTYFAMLKMRCSLVDSCATVLAKAATIATRYSAVRRQSPINPDDREPQIIDHVTQQLKLLPEIATAMAFHICGVHLWSLFGTTTKDIERGAYDRLPELHALSCVMKALCSYDCSEGVERLRLSCGGHGYLTSSNLGPLFASATAACTYEGENTVMLLQAGRYLMKSWRHAITKKPPLTPTVGYLAATVNRKDFGRWSGTWENLVQALQFTAANKIRMAFENLTKRLKAGQTEAEAANNTGIELIEAAELHGRAFICDVFLQQIVGPAARERSQALNRVLENVLELYLVQTTLKSMKHILRFINLTEDNLQSLQRRLEQTLQKIRPDAVAICDAFDFHDRALSSTLGSYDGNVYERLFVMAKKSPLNREPVPKSFEAYLKPFLKSKM